ncbi:pancreatic lipase-related protein 2 [Anopheles darlingi]|uniref:pancreatic lipase-related protein 2 n=1 Tax=Anopheles darlingi TaxID=43151 RepID=UPI0021000CB1|nr:pancreatic lipase-related protein 2 [Anopheles darlingi]
MIVVWRILKFLAFLRIVNCDMAQLKAIDPNYGVTWMFMPDDTGTPHIVDLTEPNDTARSERRGNLNEDVNFYYYRQATRANGSRFRFVNDLATPLALDESYDPKLPTKFVIHGWMNSIKSPVSQNIKNNYLQKEDMNVIVVDWEPLASDAVYFRSAMSTRDVGKHVGVLIDRMVVDRGMDLNDVHIIGHSLGAHTSGFAGFSVTKGKVGRITGLDPALPGFTDQQPTKLLDPSDAQFVDVMHTCAGLLGHDKSLGHVDFWPNGGRVNQPGCSTLDDLVGACSHGRSYEYYAESIRNPNGFKAYPCKSMEDLRDSKCRTNAVPMGDPTPDTARGNLFLETNAKPEYGKGL